MNSGPSCELYPKVSIPIGVDTQGNTIYREEDSLLYKKMLEKYKTNRPLTNYLYALYKVTDVGDKMDNANIPRNSQGEHNANDYLKFIDFSKISENIFKLSTLERNAGFIDAHGYRVDFTNAKEALEKADNFNSSHKGVVATVVQHGDIFQIITSQKDSRTHLFGDSVTECLKIWEVYEQVFNSVGIDINALPPELNNRFNALNINLAQSLRNLKNMQIQYMYKNDAWTLLALNPNSRHTQNVISAFGSIEDAAQAIDNLSHGAGGYTTAQVTLLRRAIADAQRLQGIDINALVNQVKQMSDNVHNMSPEKPVHDELVDLNKKHNIDIDEIHRTSKEIKTLSEAITESVITLNRQIRTIEREKGDEKESKRLGDIKDSLLRELKAKKYYSGILNFLQEADTQVLEIGNMLAQLPTVTGTELEKAFATTKVLQDIKRIHSKYYDLVNALSNDRLIVDESISKIDIDNFRQAAKKIKQYFEGYEQEIKDLTENTMLSIMSQTVGNTTADGQSIINAVRMAATDSTIYDYLYSMGRVSNPIVAAAGSIMRNAQDKRDGKMNEISLRLRRITDKLYKSGKDSSFIYEDEEHIISDIDWGAYETARNIEAARLIKQGLKPQTYDFDIALKDWEDQNTEDRVVDPTYGINGRTEKVPDFKFRKKYNFQDGWSQEQIDYYNEMMQLKGEIGSMLPAYAQKQYLPPQVRRKFLDALGNASSFSDVAKAFRNKVQDIYKIREDDESWNTNGVIDGIKFRQTEGNFGNTKLQQIPIFFVNKVEQGELLKNFSTGLAALAGTAVNYEAMNDIVDTVEFMRDFAEDQLPRAEVQEAEVINSKYVRVIKDLYKKGTNANTVKLMDGFIAQHIYGQKRSDWELNTTLGKTVSKIFDNIISYTSFKSLSTNLKGAFNNYIMGEFQMLIEAGAGEFYGFKDFAWAHSKLFGGSGVYGEIAELLTNNVNHKGVLLGEMFDPIQENFSNKSHKKYYKSMFRQLVGHDCSFLGYSSGEYLIHYVNMYSVLHHQKVLLNGKKVSLYDAFEVTAKQDNNSELRLKQGVTDLDGNPITNEFIDNIRKKIRYVNQTTHGSMNAEDKGLIHQKWWGRAVMSLRQWMVEHYSRRFRSAHFDATLGETREGYWQSLLTEDTRDLWNNNKHKDAFLHFMKDFYTFWFRAQSQWSNMTDMQKYNVQRVKSEMIMFAALLGLSFTLGAPDEHKRQFWRRWWIYQIKRMITETEASMPIPQALSSGLTILQSPMAATSTMSALLYAIYGLFNGDAWTKIKSGPHKGERKYERNVKKYVLPVFKDVEQMQNMDTDDAIFKVFDSSPSNH